MKLFSSLFPSFIIHSFIWTYLSHAYLEPGASSFFLKILISALAGFVFVFRYIWLGIRSLFVRPAPKKDEQKKEGDQNKG